MIENVLSQIGGIAGYGVISVTLFFAVFSAVLLWAFLQKKSLLDAMSVLPLDSDEANPKRRTHDE